MFSWPLSLYFPRGYQQLSFPGRVSWGKPLYSGFNCVLFVCVLGGFFGFVWCLGSIVLQEGAKWCLSQGSSGERWEQNFNYFSLASPQWPPLAATPRCSRHTVHMPVQNSLPSLEFSNQWNVIIIISWNPCLLLVFLRILEQIASSPCIYTCLTRSIFFSCDFALNSWKKRTGQLQRMHWLLILWFGLKGGGKGTESIWAVSPSKAR